MDTAILPGWTAAGIPADRLGFAGELAALFRTLVEHGAALGWVEPPDPVEIAALVADLGTAQRAGDADAQVAYRDDDLVGFGYWQRYQRPTHRPHADLEKVAVSRDAQGNGIGRALTERLVGSARAAGIEVLTLDVRGDNEVARSIYERLGFTRYGLLPGFGAVGERRYDKAFYALDLRTISGDSVIARSV